MNRIRPYIFNGFLLTLPMLVGNVILTNQLPPFFEPTSFDMQVPSMIIFLENLFRYLFFAVIFLMSLPKSPPRQYWSWVLYATGIVTYFCSWIPLIIAPESLWSQSLPGLSAPAWTPLLWMTGIIYICDGFSFGIPFRRWIPMVSMSLFLFFHNVHVLWAYCLKN